MNETIVATEKTASSLIANRYEKSADDQEVIDHYTGLIWRAVREQGEDEDGGETNEFTFDEAQLHAKQIAQQTGLAWRVPRIDELMSLLDYNLDFPDSSCPNMLPGPFWSSSPYVSNPNFAWYVVFSSGSVDFYFRGITFAVRLVRGG